MMFVSRRTGDKESHGYLFILGTKAGMESQADCRIAAVGTAAATCKFSSGTERAERRCAIAKVGGKDG